MLDTATAHGPGRRATALLGRCLAAAGEAVARTLTVGDREALLLHLRRLTFGETIDCVLRCPRRTCGEPMDLALGVGDLLARRRTTTCGDGPTISPSTPTARATSVRFRLPPGDDLDAAVALEPAEPERAAARAAHVAASSRAERDGGAAARTPSRDGVRRALAAAMAERDPQAEIELDGRCPECGAPFTAVFDTRQLPARASWRRAPTELLRTCTRSRCTTTGASARSSAWRRSGAPTTSRSSARAVAEEPMSDFLVGLAARASGRAASYAPGAASRRTGRDR